jgi:murein DD-endopeptidase MepM/ murein hydrolase activator NlpD
MRLPVIRTFVRNQDRWGSGEFQAPRGKRKHKGIDIACPPGAEVLAVAGGQVTRIGFPYDQEPPLNGFQDEDDRRRFHLKAALRYIEVTAPGGRRPRYFYVDPAVKVGDKIAEGRVLGIAQNLQPIYPGIIDHYHFEVLTPSGAVVNPYAFLEELP